MAFHLYELEHSESRGEDHHIHFHLFSIPACHSEKLEIVNNFTGDDDNHDGHRTASFKYLGGAVDGPGVWYRLMATGDPLYVHGELNSTDYIHNDDAYTLERTKVLTVPEATFAKLASLLTELSAVGDALPAIVRPHAECDRIATRTLLAEIPKLFCPGCTD